MEVAFSHWSASWPVLIGYLVVAAWHLIGLRPVLGAAASSTSATDRRALMREAAMFQLGLLIVVLALISPIGHWSDVYIWVRSLQELLVALVGPGLMVLGAPWMAFRFGRPAQRRPPSWLRAHPVAAVVLANVVFLGWQFPVLYEHAQASAGLALAEHASYLAAGLVFWLQLISSRPASNPNSAPRRMALLVGSVGVSTVYGMMLVFGSGVLYPSYANSAHHVMSVLDDQQLSGATWWMGVLLPFTFLGVALLMQWFRDEESAELASGLDRLLAPRRHGWPNRPVIR